MKQMLSITIVYVTFEKFVSAEDNQDYDNVPERTYMVTEEWAKEDNFRFQPKPHPCDRTCKTGDSKRCHFVFIVERITSLGKVRLYCAFNENDTYLFLTNFILSLQSIEILHLLSAAML